MIDMPKQHPRDERKSEKPQPASRQVKPKPTPPSMNVTALETVLGSGPPQSSKGDPK